MLTTQSRAIGPSNRVDEKRDNRRAFLKGSAGLGIASGIASLSACGDGSSSSATASPVSKFSDHHFFSLRTLAEKENLYAVVAGKQLALNPIDQDLLQKVISEFPALATVAANVTHYVKDIPQKALDRHSVGFIKRVPPGTHPNNGKIVRYFSKRSSEHILTAASKIRSITPGVSTKSITKSIRKKETSNTAYSMYSDDQEHAIALCLQHPELMNPDGITTEILRLYIAQASQFPAMVRYLQDNPETYAVEQPLVENNGNPLMMDDGTGSMYNPSITVPSAEVTKYIIDIGSEVMTAASNDPALIADIGSKNYSDVPVEDLSGKLFVTQDGTEPSSLSSGYIDTTVTTKSIAKKLAGTATSWVMSADDSNRLGKIDFSIVSSTFSTVTVKVENSAERYMAAYYRFYDSDGKLISHTLPDESAGFTFDLVDVTTLKPDFQTFGISVLDRKIDLNIEIPSNCTTFEILMVGEGIKSSADPYPGMAVAMCVPAGLDYGLTFIPQSLAIALAAWDAYELFSLEATSSKYILLKDFVKLIGAILVAYYLKEAALNEDGFFSDSSAIWDLINLLGSYFLTSELYLLLCIYILGEEIAKSIPVLGTILAVTSAITALNAAVNMANAIIDIATLPRTVVASFALQKAVTVSAQFPSAPAAGTKVYIYTLKTSSGWSQQIASAALSASFQNVPTGGTLTATVAGYDGETLESAATQKQILVSKGEGTFANDTNPSVVVNMEVLIRELSSSTKYGKVAVTTAVEGGGLSAQYVGWEDVNALTTTDSYTGKYGDYKPSPFFDVGNLSLNNYTKFIGRSWFSSDASTAMCVPGASIISGTPGMFGNSYSTAVVDSGIDYEASTGYLMSGYIYSYNSSNDQWSVTGNPCGFSKLPLVAYDSFGFNTSHDYYLDPDSENRIRKIGFYTKTINGVIGISKSPGYDLPTSNNSVGYFRNTPSAMVVIPGGEIVAVCPDSSTIEILKPLEEPVADVDAPNSIPIATFGDLDGRVGRPTRIAATAESILIVAEEDYGRLQAFRSNGNPVKFFAGGADGSLSRTLPLKYWTSGDRVLDLSIEHGGYIYVLTQSASEAGQPVNLDIYKPDGVHLVRNSNFDAKRLAVDLWRTLYSMDGSSTNHNGLKGYIPEPSITQWVAR